MRAAQSKNTIANTDHKLIIILLWLALFNDKITFEGMASSIENKFEGDVAPAARS